MASTGRREIISQVEAQVEANRQRFEAANARVTARVGRNLFYAVLTGVGLGGLVALALFVWEPLFLILAAAAVSLALYELATAFRLSGRRVPRIGLLIGGAIIVLAAWFLGSVGLLFGIYAACGLLIIWRLIEGMLPCFQVPWRTMVADLAAGVFSLVYVALAVGLAVLLFNIQVTGKWWVFVLILLPVCNDIGAYATGLKFGKHKMSPRVSPNKTWEGFIGAGLLVVTAATVTGTALLGLPWWGGLLLGVAALCTATGGDLIESLIKRDLGVKDMSSLIPGHGGLLDRLDSILPTTVPLFIAAVVMGVL